MTQLLSEVGLADIQNECVWGSTSRPSNLSEKYISDPCFPTREIPRNFTSSHQKHTTHTFQCCPFRLTDDRKQPPSSPLHCCTMTSGLHSTTVKLHFSPRFNLPNITVVCGIRTIVGQFQHEAKTVCFNRDHCWSTAGRHLKQILPTEKLMVVLTTTRFWKPKPSTFHHHARKLLIFLFGAGHYGQTSPIWCRLFSTSSFSFKTSNSSHSGSVLILLTCHKRAHLAS